MKIQISRAVYAALIVLSFLAAPFLGAFDVALQEANAALIPGGSVGPMNPATGFPYWYKDQNGLALELMESADTFGISAPVEPGNAFSEQIGFGAEGFWWSADAAIGTQARLTLAMEAAFAGESAVNGEQSAFGRIRYRIDNLIPGEAYTVRHPFATVTHTADAAGVINITEDIGCFALPGVTSCDPANPLGSPLPQFNFGAALSSGIGPFLTWDTFNEDPALTDPQLVNPAAPGKQYVGKIGVPHVVTGSPIGQNFFRIEGPGLTGGAIETDLFSVTGRLSSPRAPDIAPVSPQTVQAGSTLSFTVQATDVNADPISFSVLPATAIGNEASAVIDPASGLFTWTPDITGTPSFIVTASDGVLSSQVTVTVTVTATQPIVATIIINPPAGTVTAGQARQLVASVRDAAQADIVPQPPVTWTTSDGAIATIDAAGLLTAIAPGTVTVTAMSGAVAGSLDITISAVQRIGGGLIASLPVEPNTGFPAWYKDTNGLALDLMEAADTFGLSDPVDPTNPFSGQIGFNAEGFWWMADSVMETAPGSNGAVLVQAVEAAFAGEAAVDGEQSAFGRIRIRVDVPNPGTYTVTYPYGVRTYIVDTVGPGFDINDTGDIGCFALPGVTSCDPADPLGSPLPQFNFNAVSSSEIGPFLTWDTFDPLANDPALTNPAIPGRKYIGNPATPHAVKGSPTGNNFFRVEGPDIGGPGVNSVETSLFTVVGRLSDVTPPVITVLPPDPDTVVQGALYTDPGATAVDDLDGDITGRITATTITTLVPGAQTITYTVSDVAGNTSTATRTVNVTDAGMPVITLLGTNPMTIPLGTPFTDPGATATDPQDGDLSPNITVTGIVDTSIAGTYILTYNVTDLAGNTTSVARTVIVGSAIPIPVLTTITVTPAAPSVATGATSQLTAATLDQFGAPITATVTWTSSNTAAATVDANGLVTAVAPGTATITATSGVVTGSSTVTISAAPVVPVLTTIAVAPTTSTILTGTTIQLAPSTFDQNGLLMTAAVSWSSSDAAVATVDAAGLVTALTPGITTITATSGVVQGSATITVEAPPTPIPVLTTITVTPAAPSVATGATSQLTAATLDQFGAPITATVTWTSSNTAAATVDANGLVTAVAPGTATITATSGVVQGNAIVTIEAPIPVPVLTTVNVVPQTASLVIDGTRQLAAELLDQSGSPIAGSVAWSSSNPSVATVDALGIVTGRSTGVSTITATSGATSGFAIIIVSSPVLTTITIDPSVASIPQLGRRQFSAIARDQLGNVMQVPFVWSSSNRAIVRVDGTGSVLATGIGTATITATSGTVRGTANVTITPLPPPPIVNGRSVSINDGAATTGSLDVTLTLSAENATEMAISNTNNFNGVVFEPYATVKAWTLDAAGGAVKQVFVRFRNAGGRTADASDTIRLGVDVPRPRGGRGKGSAPVPSTPAVPAAPSLPAPVTPLAPSATQTPTPPSVPTAPTVPVAPLLPILPVVPGILQPSATLPSVPSAPSPSPLSPSIGTAPRDQGNTTGLVPVRPVLPLGEPGAAPQTSAPAPQTVNVQPEGATPPGTISGPAGGAPHTAIPRPAAPERFAQKVTGFLDTVRTNVVSTIQNASAPVTGLFGQITRGIFGLFGR